MYIQLRNVRHWLKGNHNKHKPLSTGCSLKSEDSSLSKVVPEAEHLVIIYFNWYLFEKNYNDIIIILINICIENSNKCCSEKVTFMLNYSNIKYKRNVSSVDVWSWRDCQIWFCLSQIVLYREFALLLRTMSIPHYIIDVWKTQGTLIE